MTVKELKEKIKIKSEFISKIRFHLRFMKCPICGGYIPRKRPHKNCYLCGQEIYGY